MIKNGEPAGARYTIQNIGAGVTVDFAATVPADENKEWWRRADSNCGPRDYETLALTN